MENGKNLDDELDSLFRLPIADFTGARNDLAARLKRSGRADDANLVKALAKPSVSAWAVNQLYWNHRQDFDLLLAAGQALRQAQATGAAAQMRGPLQTRSEAISRLSEYAAALLRDAGHNPAPDTLHRITTTLEAVSAAASHSDSPAPGRLTRDLDPPGFDSLALLMAGAVAPKAAEKTKPATTSQEPASAATNKSLKLAPAAEDSKARQLEESRTQKRAPQKGDVQKARQLEEIRKAKMAAAKASLRNAERSLTEATARALRLEGARKKADAEAKQAEKELRELEERIKKASAAAQEAAQRSERIAAEVTEATTAVEAARHNVAEASKDIEAMLREPVAG